MAKKKNNVLRKGLLAVASGSVFVLSLVFASGLVPSFAIADHTGDSSRFGIGSNTSSTSAQIGVLYEDKSADKKDDSLLQVTSESTALERNTNYDVMVGVYQIEKQREEERRAAEEAARIEEEKTIKRAQQAYSAWKAQCSRDGSSAALGLSDVDWTVGKNEFIATWTTRIDAYLAGSNLAGYGAVFAEAAWDNAIDPRWSPAISNTESGKGTVCFLPHNAWGWGQSSWSSWTQAITEHVAGLAKGYGYSVTQTYAGIYCPPNTAHWFSTTVNEMKRI